MNDDGIFAPTLRASLLSRAPSPDAAIESPPPPPPPAGLQGLAMRPVQPAFDLQFQAEVQQIQAAARKYRDGDMQHPEVVASLASAQARRDSAEDAAFPGRRKARTMSENEVQRRINAVLAYLSKSADRGDRDGYYLSAAASWITAHRADHGPEALPSLEQWRDFDSETGAKELMRGHLSIGDRVSDAANRLSPVAVRSPEALWAQALARRPFDLVIADYGQELSEKEQRLRDTEARARADAAEGVRSRRRPRMG